jgi:hypothetical protein
MSIPLANPKPKAHIILGVTGGIAAYKACELVRLLTQACIQCSGGYDGLGAKICGPG